MLKPLSETNPYMKNPETRERLIDRSVSTSSAVEGIKVNFDAKSVVISRRADKKIYKRYLG